VVRDRLWGVAGEPGPLREGAGRIFLDHRQETGRLFHLEIALLSGVAEIPAHKLDRAAAVLRSVHRSAGPEGLNLEIGRQR